MIISNTPALKSFLGAIILLQIALSGTASAGTPNHQIHVMATTTIIADMAQNVAGDRAIIRSLVKPGAEIHDYDPTPGDIAAVQESDLLLTNGLGLERWLGRFFENAPAEIPVVPVSKLVKPIKISEGPYKGSPNPHAWMSPAAAVLYVENIREALIAADPENAKTYRSNAAAYEKQILDVIEPIKEEFSLVPSQNRWIATSEGAFSYLARDFGLKELYLWPVNSDQEGTPQQIRHMIDVVRKEHIPAIFSESTVSTKPALEIARETGAAYGGILYVDSLSASDGPTPTYIDLIRTTASTVAHALTAASHS